GPGTPGRGPRRASPAVDHQGTGRAGMPAGRERAAGPGRGTARTGMGRSGRPVHHHGEDHHPPAPGQARRPAGDPDRPGKRLPHRRTLMRTHGLPPGPPHWLRLPRRTARLRLTVLYGGAVFLACGATVLAFTYLLYGLLAHAPHLVLLHHERGKLVAVAAPPPEATIRVAGLGQIAVDRQQLPIVSGIAPAVIAAAPAAIRWLIARPPPPPPPPLPPPP